MTRAAPASAGALPEGERILWQGAPCWRVTTRRVFLARAVAWYFLALIGWRFAAKLGAPGADGGAPVGAGEAFVYAIGLLPVAALGLGILAVLAWGVARTTTYTITDRRVILHYGVAVDLCLNLPFTRIESAAVKRFPTGAGDVALRLTEGEKLSYAMLWPHARPWRVTRPEPSLRCLADVAPAAEVLAQALAAHAATVEDAPERAAAEAALQGRPVTPSVEPSPARAAAGGGRRLGVALGAPKDARPAV